MAGIDDVKSVKEQTAEMLTLRAAFRLQEPGDDAPSLAGGLHEAGDLGRRLDLAVGETLTEVAGRAVGGVETGRDGEELGGGAPVNGVRADVAAGQIGQVGGELAHGVGVQRQKVALEKTLAVIRRHIDCRGERQGQEENKEKGSHREAVFCTVGRGATF
jgi:hypothetical protein